MTDRELWPDFLQRLRELMPIRHLERRRSNDYEPYLVDLSEWKLRFSERTPLIWVKAGPAHSLSAQQLRDSLRELATVEGWQQRECLVLLDGNGKELRSQTSRQYFPRFVIIDADDQDKLLSARTFSESTFLNSLKDIVCEQVPIRSLSPYQVSAPVTGSRFFGREKEVNQILRMSDASFAILGVRRIGKTSLLKEIERRLIEHGEDPKRFVRLDVTTIHSPDEFVREVVRQLNIREFLRLEKQKQHLYFPNFLQRMSSTYKGRLTIFLDEVDPFLIWARNEPNLLSTLRASVHTGHCRYIVAGFEILLRELYNHDSPFYRAFEKVRLKPFTKKDTENLVLGPTESMRVKFDNQQEVVSRIHSDTRGYPRLVQFYCSHLMEELDHKQSRTITLQSVNELYVSDEFKEEILNSFRDNTETKERLLIYAMLASFPESKDSFTQDEMFGALKRHNYFVPHDELDRLCDHLVLIGVLIRDGLKYEYAMPVFPHVIRLNQNVDYSLAVTRRELQQ